MVDIEAIKELFLNNNIPIYETILSPKLEAEHFPDDINEYLCIMNNSVKLHVSPYGTAKTYLMSQKEIVEEYRLEELLPIINNNYLMIGFGANGDLICLNLVSGDVTYVFHDILWEESEEPFDEMSISLNMKLEQFLKLAFSREDYPFDAYLAEKYVNSDLCE